LEVERNVVSSGIEAWAWTILGRKAPAAAPEAATSSERREKAVLSVMILFPGFLGL
jgi:hypothetical protein